jgi:8-oxo-dGTP diphosphatase
MEKFVKVAAHALIKRGNRYLVTKRSDTDDFMPGLWDLPGGTIRFGESIESALNREVFEETGLKIEIRQLVYVYQFVSAQVRHQFQIVYKCDYVSGNLKLDSRFHQEFKWLYFKDIHSLKCIDFLKEYLKSSNVF